MIIGLIGCSCREGNDSHGRRCKQTIAGAGTGEKNERPSRRNETKTESYGQTDGETEGRGRGTARLPTAGTGGCRLDLVSVPIGSGEGGEDEREQLEPNGCTDQRTIE